MKKRKSKKKKSRRRKSRRRKRMIRKKRTRTIQKKRKRTIRNKRKTRKLFQRKRKRKARKSRKKKAILIRLLSACHQEKHLTRLMLRSWLLIVPLQSLDQRFPRYDVFLLLTHYKFIYSVSFS
jgi:hypothetical protein